MSDFGHNQTDEMLAELEKKISKVYKQASDEMAGTVTKYFKQFEARDAKEHARYEAGEITKQEYTQWRLTQMGRGERYQDMQNKLAERYTNANQTAISYVNDATPGIYSLNRNYGAYTIEGAGANVDFAAWDEQTVKRLITENPDLMPNYPEWKAVARGIDLAFGKEQITDAVTSGILQGHSVYEIANDLLNRIDTMSRESAIRAARTAVTEAENAGRQDAFEEAEDMGIEMQKEWVATLDERTREAHADADGQVVDVDDPFKVGGENLMYPGDDSMGASGWNIYNCRCTVVSKLKDIDDSDATRWTRDGQIEDMPYNEWMEIKEDEGDTVAEELNLPEADDDDDEEDDGRGRRR